MSRAKIARYRSPRKGGAPSVNEGAARAGRAERPDRRPSAPRGGSGGVPPRLDTSETSRHPTNPYDPAQWRKSERARIRLAESCSEAAAYPDVGRAALHEGTRLRKCGVIGAYTDERGHPVMRLGRDGIERPAAQRWWCRSRACPHCGRRVSGERAAALAGHIMARDLRPIFVTLTQKRHPQETAGEATERIMKAWKRLQRHKVWKDAVAGFVWKRESTWARNKGHHVHLHLLIETRVRRDFAFTHKVGGKKGTVWYTDTSWIDVEGLRRAWRVAAGTPEVNVDTAPLREGVAEVTKYACKTADLLGMPPAVLGEWLLTARSKRHLGCDRSGVFQGWAIDLHDRDAADQARAAEAEDDGEAEIIGWSLLDRRAVRRKDARMWYANELLPCGVEVRAAWRMLAWWGWECAHRCEVERPPAPDLCARPDEPQGAVTHQRSWCFHALMANDEALSPGAGVVTNPRM